MSSQFVQNRECEYFPCHKGVDPKTFNCLFCYCPLYALGEACGGSFTYTKDSVKDCSSCRFPHRPENYERVCEKLSALIAQCKKK